MSLPPYCCAVINLVFPGGTQFLQPWHVHFGSVEAWVHGRNPPMLGEWEKRGRSRQASHAMERRDPHAGQRLAEGVHLGWTQLKLGNMVREPFMSAPFKCVNHGSTRQRALGRVGWHVRSRTEEGRWRGCDSFSGRGFDGSAQLVWKNVTAIYVNSPERQVAARS
ncbi:hypothetical protein LY76DRAFT_146090 [Colletotrichum caudatum]|nr:hypothetical protein LY76DRAFT_146090 [Colletotrichum caudatum]